jgi:putative nucleotidyltransferase with HDIG domain
VSALRPFILTLDAIHNPAALIRRDGAIVAMNSSFRTFFGVPSDQTVPAPLELALPDPGAREVVCPGDFSRITEAEVRSKLRSGREAALVVSARVLADSATLRDHRLTTFTDVSPMRSAEASMQEQYRTIAELSNTILNQAVTLREQTDVLEARVRARTADLRAANLDTIYMLAIASEAKDQDTGRHIRRIQKHATNIARELGFSERDAEAIGYSSVLHDVGKMHVPDDVLKKPGALTPDERTIIEQHTIVGERILGTNPFFDRARRIARSHHENFDGSGYPDGRRGEETPVEARIVHVVDVFDALTHARVYKAAWEHDRAVDMLREGRGVVFDPQVVDAFQSVIAAHGASD